MNEVRWQGGCELRCDENEPKIGNLYVTDEEVMFIEAGRGGIAQYRQAITMALFAGALFLVPISAEVYAWTYVGGARGPSVVVLEGVCAVLGLLALAYAGVLRKKLAAAYIEGLKALGGDENERPEVEMLRAAVDAVGGSLQVAILDIEALERKDDRVELRTRLGDHYSMLVLPSLEGFMAAVNRRAA